MHLPRPWWHRRMSDGREGEASSTPDAPRMVADASKIGNRRRVTSARQTIGKEPYTEPYSGHLCGFLWFGKAAEGRQMGARCERGLVGSGTRVRNRDTNLTQPAVRLAGCGGSTHGAWRMEGRHGLDRGRHRQRSARPSALQYRGPNLHRAGRIQEAESAVRRALQISPKKHSCAGCVCRSS